MLILYAFDSRCDGIRTGLINAARKTLLGDFEWIKFPTNSGVDILEELPAKIYREAGNEAGCIGHSLDLMETVNGSLNSVTRSLV